jgi:hypothetical protein
VDFRTKASSEVCDLRLSVEMEFRDRDGLSGKMHKTTHARSDRRRHVNTVRTKDPVVWSSKESAHVCLA